MLRLFLFFISIPVFLFAQETREITTKRNNSKEVYHVLVSNDSIMHGPYKKYGYKDVMLLTGFYKMGMMDSLWTTYSQNQIKSKGHYKSNRKIGLWEYYSEGELIQQFDFSRYKVLYHKMSEEEMNKEYLVYTDTSTIMVKVERPPVYLGGSNIYNEFLSQNLSYPKHALQAGISGEVLVGVTINTGGGVSNYRIVNGIGGGCDEEALRVIKEIPNMWIPGIYMGRAVEMEIVVPVRFVIRTTPPQLIKGVRGF